MPGDSPILPVQVHGTAVAMFFSPGFVPLLFRNNGAVVFPKYRRLSLRQQDGDVQPVFASIARDLSIGGRKPADRAGYLLPEPDDRTVEKRPIVGMLGRDILREGSIVELDLPGRRMTIATPQVGCQGPPRLAPPDSIDMQQEILLVPIRINGQLIQAVLEPDLPVSILPTGLADKAGISDADLANDPSVVTKFGRGVLERRHYVDTLDVGSVQMQHVAFDVEDDVKYAMLGLKFFDLGVGTFDLQNQKFVFRQTTDILPAPTRIHFDQTKVVQIKVDE